ncbi:unnamed protein product [Blepharisma stoltei]|uniref:EF-hand domain-containing protein n=1 Tax=Blepharisma stoltei TaxID=1481888 RepID=A0AAU9K344_9CILI|nr:unnamed protein product [Blepharisma stoltei]
MKIKKAILNLLNNEQKLEEFVRGMYSAIDTNNDGHIDVDELYEALKSFSQLGDDLEPLTIENIKSAISELTENPDAKVVFEEFKNLVLAALQFIFQRESTHN